MKISKYRNYLFFIVFLCFTQMSFAGWSRSGTYFKVHDGSSTVITCSFFESGAGENRSSYSVNFDIYIAGEEKVRQITFLDLSTKNGDIINKSDIIILYNGILREGVLYFYDNHGIIYKLNIITQKIDAITELEQFYDIDFLNYVKDKLLFRNGSKDVYIFDTKSLDIIKKITFKSEIYNIDSQPNEELFLISLHNGLTKIYDSNSLKLKDTVTNTYFSSFTKNNEIAFDNQTADSVYFYNIKNKKILSKVKSIVSNDTRSIKDMDNRYVIVEYEGKHSELREIAIINKKSGITYKSVESRYYNGSHLSFFEDASNTTYLGYKDKALQFLLKWRGNNNYSIYKQDVSDLFNFKEDNKGPIISVDGYNNFYNNAFTTTKEVILIKGSAYDEGQKTNHPITTDPSNASYHYFAKDSDGLDALYVGLNMGLNTIPISAKDKYGNETIENLIIKRVNKTRGAIANSNKTSIEDKIASYSYKALLISNQNYTNGIDLLEYPIRDATKFKEILENDYSFKKKDIVHINDASRSQIINVLDSLASTITESDNLLIFYAGHGVFDENLKKGYWLPIDADSERKSNWVSNSDIRDYLTSFKSQHTLLITDACFSGSIFEYDKRNLKKKALKVTEKLLEKKSRKAMTSGLNKPVPDESIFIKYLLKELEKNKKSFIRAGELYNEIREAIMANTDNNPQFEIIRNAGHEGGEFIFLKRE